MGSTSGYYDSRGNWISTSTGTNGNGQPGIPRDLRDRISWTEQYIRTANRQGTLGRAETSRSLREIRIIRDRERSMRHNRRGELSVRDEAALTVRLDRLHNRLRIAPEMNGGR